MSEILLQTKALTKQYGHQKAVDNVDIHIKKGANLWIYRQKRCRQDYLYENDWWSGKADKRRDIHVWIRWKGFVKGTLKSGLPD